MKSAIKTVAVLLGICLVCGFLLAICNDLFFISDNVRFERAMKNIYPDFADDGKPAVDSSYKAPAYGSIAQVFKSKDGAYILETTGNGGYKGTVTTYTVIGADAKIKAWTVKEYTGETLMSNIGDAQYKSWYIGQDISGGIALGNFYVSGTTKSSTAINNAINVACDYAMNCLGLGANPEKDAKDAVLAEMTKQGMEGFTLESAINVATKIGATTIGEIYGNATYIFKGTAEGKNDVLAYVYVNGETTSFVVVEGSQIKVNSGVEDSVANDVALKTLKFNAFGSSTIVTILRAKELGENAATYTIDVPAVSGYQSSAFEFKVTVAQGKVADIAITVNGSTYAPAETANATLSALYKDVTLDTIDGMSGNKISQATQTSNIFEVVVKSALSQYAIDFAN